MDEQILVIRKNFVFEFLSIVEGTENIRTYSEGIMDFLSSKFEFMPRISAERDPSYLQIIPYVVISSDKGAIFSAVRTNSTGEKRLHGMRTVGFGGHCNPTGSSSLREIIATNISRELDEELVKLTTYNLNPLICIYDGTTEVNRVHFGIVYDLSTKQKVELKEDCNKEGAFLNLHDICPEIPKYEIWSQLVITEKVNKNVATF